MSVNKKEVKLLIPVKVIETVDSLVSVMEISNSDKTRLKIKLIELWYKMYTYIQSVNKTSSIEGYHGLDSSKFVNIPSSELNSHQIKIEGKVIHHHPLIDMLVDGNLIDVNDKYSSGNFSKSYRCNQDIFMFGLEYIKIDFSKMIKDNKTMEQWIKEYPNHSKLIKECYDAKIDLNKYFKWLHANKGKNLDGEGVERKNNKKSVRDENGKVVKKTMSTGKEKAIRYTISSEGRILDDARIFDYQNDAIKYNLGILWFNVSSTGRFYSSLTSLQSAGVEFIKLSGQSVVQIDAKNSQPLLLNHFIDNPSYKADAESGCVYEKIAEYLGISRQEAKIKSYEKIFFSESLMSEKYVTMLNSIWGNLGTQINELKTTSLLWELLQGLEAEIFVNFAKDSLFKILTRHDSIIIHKQFKTMAVKALQKVYKSYNLKVTLDVK